MCEYYAFWDELLKEFKVKKDEIIVREERRQPINKSVFGIYPDDNKTYTKILRAFETIIIKKFESFLQKKLKEKFNYYINGSVTILKSSCFNIFVDNGFEKHLIALKTSFSSLNSKSIKKMVDSQLQIDKFTRVHIVFLQEDNLENSRACYNLQWKISNLGIKFFSVSLFENFMDEMFGTWNKDIFLNGLEYFKENIYKVVGYQLTKLCTPENWGKFKNKLEKMIQSYDYDKIKITEDNKMKGSKRNRSLILRDNSYSLMKRTFLSSERYKLLLGGQNFANSFMTSEWLYQNYITDNTLDNTFVVAGYLKSIEQLLWNIIYLVSVGGEKERKLGKGEEKYKKVISESNRDTIDSTLGSLGQFLSDNQNKDIFLSSFGSNRAIKKVMGYLEFQLSDWRRNQRNGYFHKHNLNKKENVDVIRDETIFLYLLILGSIELDSDQLKQLA